MKKRTTYLILILIILVNILLRYPTTLHEKGVDSFHVHTLADTITKYGMAKWYIHPFSFVGVYPFSHESGGPLWLSAFSQLTNISMEYTILFLSVFLGIIAAPGSFMLGKALTSNTLYGCFLASIYSTSRLFLGFTDWTFSTRGIFIALLPVAIYSVLTLMLRNRRDSWGNYSLPIIFFPFLLTLHKLFLFLVLIFITGLLLLIIRNTRAQKLDYNKPGIRNIYLLSISVLFLLTFFDIIVVGRGETEGQGYYRLDMLEAGFSSLDGPLAVFVNLVIEYTIGIGLLAIFFPAGILFTLYSKSRSLHKEFTLIILFTGVIFVMDIEYFRTFFGIFISLLVTTGVFNTNLFLSKTSKKYLSHGLIIFVLVVSPIAPEFIVLRAKEMTTFDDNEISMSQDTGLYIMHNADGVTLVLGGASGRYTTAAYSGGTTTFDFNTDVLIHGKLPAEILVIESDYDFIDLWEGEKQIFTVRDWVGDGNYHSSNRHKYIAFSSYDDSVYGKYYLLPYQPSYFFQTTISGSSSTHETDFMVGVGDNTYKIFANGLHGGWYISFIEY